MAIHFVNVVSHLKINIPVLFYSNFLCPKQYLSRPLGTLPEWRFPSNLPFKGLLTWSPHDSWLQGQTEKWFLQIMLNIFSCLFFNSFSYDHWRQFTSFQTHVCSACKRSICDFCSWNKINRKTITWLGSLFRFKMAVPDSKPICHSQERDCYVYQNISVLLV